MLEAAIAETLMRDPLVILWICLAIFFAASALTTMLRYRPPRRARGGELLACSIILPIKGNSQFLQSNLEALGRLEPFHGEILLAVAHPEDAALPVIQPIVAKYSDRMKLLIGEALEFSNPKLRNMAKAYQNCREDTLLFLDDTVELDAALYGELLNALKSEITAATAAPFGTEAENFPARIEAATCNGYVFRLEMFFELFRTAGAFGNALAIRKSDLEALGGLRRLTEGPCEDRALVAALRGAGRRLSILPTPIKRRIGRRSWWEIYLRHLRWKNCTKCHDPIPFVLEPLIGGLIFNLLGAYALSVLLGISPWAALSLSLLGWYGTEALIHAVVGWKISLADPFAWIARDIAHPLITLAALFTNRVQWRGETIEMGLLARGRAGKPQD
jgi:ceramide glucosyltransferase